jgi:glycosyltransferase involved in cell wall biosynthesis
METIGEHKPLISICIPVYEMHNSGTIFLDTLLQSIATQKDVDWKDIEVVISDHSVDDKLGDVVSKYSQNYEKLNLKYLKNELNRGSSSHNINNCIRNSSGKWIKPIFQDDYFSNNTALREINLAITLQPLTNFGWGAQKYHHYLMSNGEHFRERIPLYNVDIQSGNNSIGPPSCVFFKNEDNYFDENLIWYMDTEFYHRLYLKYGPPYIFEIDGIVNTLWDGQITNTVITNEVKEKEQQYLLSKMNTFEQKVLFLKRHPTAAADIKEHLDTLVHYASKCDTIVEMGMRSIVSTWAFLAGKPKKMVSVDIAHPDTYSFIPGSSTLEEVESQCRMNDIEFEFKLSDSRTVKIPECDLLFIDTLHDEDQIRAELEAHASKAKRYIIFHDTTTFASIGETQGKPGIWQPIYELLMTQDWRLVQRFNNNNGLTIIERIKKC